MSMKTKQRIGRWWLVWLLVGLGVGGAVAAARAADQAAWMQKVDPHVLHSMADGAEAEFLIVLAAQADLRAAAAAPTKLAKGQAVYAALTAVAQNSQPPLIAELESRGAPYRRFWVRNMLWTRGDAATLAAVARRPDVARIHANPAVRLDAPPPLDAAAALDAATAVAWNIELVNAPQAWAAGVTGQGVVIGGQDTGYDWTHPTLRAQYRGWDAVTGTAGHDYHWHDAIHADHPNTAPGNPCGFDAPAPCDDNGHGTHTMGTMVGSDGGANQVGMAPGARWIGCRNMEQGWGTPAGYAECYEWFIAPYPRGGDPFTDGNPAQAPHVINNSWSCPAYEGCTDPDVLQAVVEAVRAAGVVTVHAAGNAGPACSSINTPPAIYAASFTVAATDGADNAASFSSRGPVLLGSHAPAKPDVAAPGVGVRSSAPGGRYTVSSGTSMAAPHVAGLTALLIAAQPALAGDVDGLEQLMAQTAVPRTSAQGCGGDSPTAVPNHVYGWGRIDAWAAVREALNAAGPRLHKAAAPTVQSGAPLTYTLSVTNTTSAPLTSVVLTDTLPGGATLLSASPPFTLQGETVIWQTAVLPSGAAWQVELVVQAPVVTQTAVLTNADYGVRSAGDGAAVRGLPVTTAVAPPPAFALYLPLLRHD